MDCFWKIQPVTMKTTVTQIDKRPEVKTKAILVMAFPDF